METSISSDHAYVNTVLYLKGTNEFNVNKYWTSSEYVAYNSTHYFNRKVVDGKVYLSTLPINAILVVDMQPLYHCGGLLTTVLISDELVENSLINVAVSMTFEKFLLIVRQFYKL